MASANKKTEVRSEGVASWELGARRRVRSNGFCWLYPKGLTDHAEIAYLSRETPLSFADVDAGCPACVYSSKSMHSPSGRKERSSEAGQVPATEQERREQFWKELLTG